MTPSPLEVLREAEGYVKDAEPWAGFVGDHPEVEKYRTALTDVEKLVEAANELCRPRTSCEGYEEARNNLEDALVPFAE